MSANQRRSGFRLPWLADEDPEESSSSPDAAPATSGESTAEPTSAAAPEAPARAAPPPAAASTNGVQAAEPTEVKTAAAAVTRTSDSVSAANGEASAEPPNPFIRDLIAAMRRVAEEARASGVATLRADADEAVRSLQADAEKRRQELRERADADVEGVGEWARAEAERIKEEAERRVAARHAQLEEQLTAEEIRTEAEANALRSRVDDYERELEAFHAQLSEINDPAAFAAAAKRMPAPPPLAAAASSPPTPADTTPGSPTPEVHPAEEEVLAARLAELEEKGEASPATAAAASAEPAPTTANDGASVTTDIVVKGLGSFGAITGFRQSLSGQSGITAVALSLGQNGEFVFRASHAPGFDLAGAITAMEGDGATVEPRAEGGLRVTLERSR
ncbi:MAG: hypothetical protein KY392_05645 [Chloroflexi bacterium]|nr:hypothetical protein [Chloroflexota bacterium]